MTNRYNKKELLLALKIINDRKNLALSSGNTEEVEWEEVD